MKILYFTSTGNSLYVAKRLGGELISIPQALKAGNLEYKDEKIGLVFPVFGGAVPQYVERFLRQAKLDSPYVFSVLTYGMMAGDAGRHLQRIASETGIRFSYINDIKMVDNWVLNFDMEEQLKKEPKKQIETNLDSIISDVQNGNTRMPKGSFLGRYLSKSMASKFAIGPGLAKDYVVEDSCIGCGACANVCPLDNIVVEEKRPRFGSNCASCLACTHNCPKNSIRVKKEKSRARFRNQHITLKEIEMSNK